MLQLNSSIKKQKMTTKTLKKRKTRRLPFEAKPGDIVFTANGKPVSWVLRVLQGNFPYSHGCIIGETEKGGPTLYTTGDPLHPEFVRVDAATYLADKSYVVCRYMNGGRSLTKDQIRKILDFSKQQIGEMYPTKKVAKYLAAGFKASGIKELVDQELKEREHCFESIAKAYFNAGIVLTPRAGNTCASGYDGKEIYLSPNLVDIFTKTRTA